VLIINILSATHNTVMIVTDVSLLNGKFFYNEKVALLERWPLMRGTI
jgi:hypothetical protein